MSQVAKEAGLSRESLFKALSVGGNPEFSVVLRVARVLGLKVTVVAVA
jgi:probable addiction module antidote protein